MDGGTVCKSSAHRTAVSASCSYECQSADMSPSLVIPLERPFSEFRAGSVSAKTVLLAGLCWPTEYWVELALRWIEQGAPVDADVAAALETLPEKQFSQRTRHRAKAALKGWKK